MRTIKTCIVLAIAACLCVSLAACGTGMSADDILNKVKTSLDGIQKMECTLKMDMALQQDGNNVSMVSSGYSKEQKEPMLGEAKMSIEIPNAPKQESESYIEAVDGKLAVYTKVGGQWITQSIEMEDVSKYNQSANLKLYLENAKNFSLSGETKVGEKDAYQIQGTISGESLESVIKDTDLFNSNQMTVPEDAFANLGDMPITIWAEKESLLPIKYYLVMTDVINSVFTNLKDTPEMAGTNITVSNYTVEMEVVKINDEVGDIVIPAEARTATAVDPSGVGVLPNASPNASPEASSNASPEASPGGEDAANASPSPSGGAGDVAVSGSGDATGNGTVAGTAGGDADLGEIIAGAVNTGGTDNVNDAPDGASGEIPPTE